MELDERPWELKGGEIDRLCFEAKAEAGYDALSHWELIARLQARKLWRWERQTCKEHPWYEDGKGEAHYLSRQFCPECQQHLRREVSCGKETISDGTGD